MSVAPPLLEMTGIEKSFSGVRAVRQGRLELVAGEVHALLGENGAGKSTLIKVLAGALAPEAGRIRIGGREVRPRTPAEARRFGVAVIYQEFNLVPSLSIRDNLFLGREQARGGWIRAGLERQVCGELLERVGLERTPETPVRNLSVAEQQLVEIAKALSDDARIMVMDEPTAALSEREVERLFRIVRALQQAGLGIVYVTHRLDEVFALADRATVMRDGETIATRPVSELNRSRLIELMVGRALESEFPRRGHRSGGPRLAVRGLCRGRAVRDVSFEVRRGEVLGLAGLVGAGRTEVARLLFGADRPEAGAIEVDGRSVRIRCPRDAIRAGICLLTEDRKNQGLVLGLPVLDNFALPNLGTFSKAGWVRQRAVLGVWARFADQLRIRVQGPAQRARELSGGNQQKVVLAKWLQANSEVLLFDEPTRGVDVGARFEIYQLINELAAAGKAVLLISSDLPEVLGMSDRILVMAGGRVTGEIADRETATQADLLRLATPS